MTTLLQTRPATTATQRWVLGLSSLASFLVVLDMLVVATALTTIQRDLGASLADLEWTVNAYTLTFAVFLMAAAVLGGRLGRRRVFVGGLALFGLASAACALATDVGGLVAARAVQGLGAAAVMPMALVLLNAAFPPERRGWALGIYGSVTGLAATLGPVLGGAVAQGLSWQWIFWLNVPIAVAVIPFVLARITEGYGAAAPVDLPGLALGAAAALGLVWGLIRAADQGWTDPVTVALLAGGALGAAAFIAWERRTATPTLPMRLFAVRGFAAGNVVIFLINGTLTGTIFLTAQFLQVAAGHDPLQAGLRLLPWGVAPLLIAPQAGVLADRFGERRLVVAGEAVFALGLAWLAAVARPDAAYIALAVPMTLAAVGFSVAIPAVVRAVVGTAAPADLGVASGAYSTMRQLGGAFGVAVMAAAFAGAGGYGSPVAFADGFRAAAAVGAVLAVAGGLAGLGLRNATPAVDR